MHSITTCQFHNIYHFPLVISSDWYQKPASSYVPNKLSRGGGTPQGMDMCFLSFEIREFVYERQIRPVSPILAY